MLKKLKKSVGKIKIPSLTSSAAALEAEAEAARLEEEVTMLKKLKKSVGKIKIPSLSSSAAALEAKAEAARLEAKTAKIHLLNRNLTIAFAVFAVVARFLLPAPTFAFDKTFPEDGSAWDFKVVLDKDSTALAEKEAELLDTLEMSPLFRCKSGLFGERWMGKSLFHERAVILKRIYKLVLEDASPPDENTFIVRHQIFGIKCPMKIRHDKFMCAGKHNKDGVCTKWDSDGYVHPFFVKRLTNGATSNPLYKQKIKMVPKSNRNPKICPLDKSAWWCLWIFCPTNYK